jgi:putative tricarboxylic transport membrane protein
VSEAATNAGTCIAPANPGGGWDLTCRATAETLGPIAPEGKPLRVTNMPGDGGGVAFKHVVSDERGNDRVLAAASPSTLLGIAQLHYGAHTERDVRWIAALDAEPSVIAVAADAPWRTLDELLVAWRAHPESITSGGTSFIGGQDLIKMLLLARAAGVDIRRVRYVPLGGPPDVVTAMHSGAVQIYPGEASKVLPQVKGKEFRVLAVLGEKRASGVLADVPTAREQGLDIVFVVWRGFYAPPGISNAAYDQWVDRLRAMSRSPQWNAMLERNGLTPFFLGGREFEQFVTTETEAYRKVSKEIGIIP